MRKNKKSSKAGRFEKKLVRICCALLVLFPIASVISKAAYSNVNLEVEKLKREITVQKNANESLTMKVNELKSLANIDIVAENEGLSYNSNNIKVISNN